MLGMDGDEDDLLESLDDLGLIKCRPFFVSLNSLV